MYQLLLNKLVKQFPDFSFLLNDVLAPVASLIREGKMTKEIAEHLLEKNKNYFENKYQNIIFNQNVQQDVDQPEKNIFFIYASFFDKDIKSLDSENGEDINLNISLDVNLTFEENKKEELFDENDLLLIHFSLDDDSKPNPFSFSFNMKDEYFVRINHSFDFFDDWIKMALTAEPRSKDFVKKIYIFKDFSYVLFSNENNETLYGLCKQDNSDVLVVMDCDMFNNEDHFIDVGDFKDNIDAFKELLHLNYSI